MVDVLWNGKVGFSTFLLQAFSDDLTIQVLYWLYLALTLIENLLLHPFAINTETKQIPRELLLASFNPQ